MPTSTHFLVLALLSEIALYGQSAPTGTSERIMSLCLQTMKGNVNLDSVYAPTPGASPGVKDSFYEALADTVSLMNIDEPLFILGDFNAHVRNQRIHWPRALGYHGTGKMNENGQRLLAFCTINDLAITNAFLALKDQHKAS